MPCPAKHIGHALTSSHGTFGRGTSVYLVNRRIDMIPSILSTGKHVSLMVSLCAFGDHEHVHNADRIVLLQIFARCVPTWNAWYVLFSPPSLSVA